MKIPKLFSVCLIGLTIGCEAARPVTWTVPRYPDVMHSANVEGYVVAHIPIAADGTPGRIHFDATPGFYALFGQAVTNAFRDAKFVPARHFGRPVSSEITVPVSFVLTARPDSCPSPRSALEQVVCARFNRRMRTQVY